MAGLHAIEAAHLLWALVVACACVTTTEALFGPVPCPGLLPGLLSLECGAACQEATCKGLVSFFKSTYNATTPFLTSWRIKNGWESVLTKDCSQILATPTADGTPSYCSWHGVTCCSRPAQFMGYCNITNALIKLRLDANGLNGSISEPAFEQGVGQLHACGLMSLVVSGNALSGTMSPFWGKLTTLLDLNLAKNMIEGTLPEALRNLTSLLSLTLDRNPMHGTVPEWVSEMKSLFWLGLSALTGHHPAGRQGLVGTIPESLGSLPLEGLSLDSNSLTGPMPASLCRPNTSLKFLLLRGNRISGNVAQLLSCTKAVFLDLRNNKFGGTLPDIPSWGWNQLSVLDMRGNELEGTLPNAMFSLDILSNLLLGDNRLNGTIPSAMGRMNYLMNVNLENNQLTGTIDEGIWYMPRLQTMELSGNRLTGTLSNAIGYGYYITTLKLDNNNFTGHVPPVLGILPGLISADLRNNSFSHLSPQHTVAEHLQQENAQELPCFLSLSDYTMPLPDASNMECPQVLRKPRELAVKDCLGSDITQLGTQASSIPVDIPKDQAWHFDSSYTFYRGCTCLGGYQAVWNSDKTILRCTAIPAGWPSWLMPLAAVLTSVFALILAAVGLLVWLKLTVQLRRKWQREKELNNNRLKGVPNGGPAAIVVTDVEKYSELMQHNAALTTRAMGIHNAILRKAVAVHAGHVIEQEGDSWSVAFHRPVDAVAFCLQVQQALQRTQWPDELVSILATKSVPEKPLISGSALSNTSQVTAEIVINTKSRHSIESPSAISLLTAHAEKQADYSGGLKHDKDSTLTTSSLAGRMSGLLQHLLGRGARKIIPDDGSVIEGSEADASDGTTSMRIVNRGAVGTYRHSVDSVTSNDRGTSVTNITKNANSTSSKLKSKHMKLSRDEVLGLKVRMGIVNGWIPANSDIKTSAVFVMAKAVSDMANGGQILMESRTAYAVRDWLSDLGCVDHKGYNDKLLSTSHNQASRIHTSGIARWLISLMSCALRVTVNERDPILLDMGQFWVPSLLSTAQAVTAALRAGGKTTAYQRFGSQRCIEAPTSADKVLVADGRQGSIQASVSGLSTRQCQKACVAIFARLLGRGSSAVTASDGVGLYSIVAHPLYVRSKIWRNDLNMKENTQQVVKGYFAAPGSLMANLSSAATAFLVERPLLPLVTMVFAAVDEGKLLHKKEAVARTVFDAIGRLLQALLLSFPDGYLCREQEAVLKYMVAFREPARAAEWCLLVQEVLQYVPWPAEVIEAFNSGAFHPSRSTAGATRASGCGGMQRPGLKMGLAEGVPDSITPDHLGRADYFGTSVNLAARIMSAAAHSGQVVMSSELAESIFSAWRYEAELGMHTVPEQDQGQGAVDDWQQFSLSGAAEGQHHEATHGEQPTGTVGGSVVPPAGTSARMPAALPAAGLDTKWAGLDAAAASDAEQPTTTSTRLVRISAHHIGTYGFKGCGAMDMVCLTSDAVIGMVTPQAVAPAAGSKGTLIMAADGPVLGMQDYPVTLPDVLPEFKQAWSS